MAALPGEQTPAYRTSSLSQLEYDGYEEPPLDKNDIRHNDPNEPHATRENTQKRTMKLLRSKSSDWNLFYFYFSAFHTRPAILEGTLEKTRAFQGLGKTRGHWSFCFCFRT